MADETRGQRSKTCDMIGCEEKGRILAHMGNIDIAYCPTHRKKYGERIINALINSRFNFKLTNFLSGVKKDIFMSDNMFCEECASKLKTYVIDKSDELDNIIEYQEENDAVFDESLK